MTWSISSDVGAAIKWVQRELSSSGDIVPLATLSRKIYERLHAGWTRPLGAQMRIRDSVLEDTYLGGVPHALAPIPVEVIDTDSQSTTLSVDGVRVRASTSAIQESGTRVVVGRQVLPMPAVRPWLSPGFFLVDGGSGRPSGTSLVRVYVAMDSTTSAIDVWARALAEFEAAGLRYRAKIASLVSMFPRSDALVVYCDSQDLDFCAGVLLRVVSDLSIDVPTSLFTCRLGPSVAYAYEPIGSGGRLSFGEHRSRALAEGVLESETAKGRDVVDCVRSAFLRDGIDPDRPWLNVKA